MSPNAKYNASFQATTLYWYCRPGGHGICVTLYLTFDKYESGVGAYIFINNYTGFSKSRQIVNVAIKEPFYR